VSRLLRARENRHRSADGRSREPAPGRVVVNGLDKSVAAEQWCSGFADLEADLSGQLAGSNRGRDGEACAMSYGSITGTDRPAVSNETTSDAAHQRPSPRSPDIPSSTR